MRKPKKYDQMLILRKDGRFNALQWKSFCRASSVDVHDVMERLLEKEYDIVTVILPKYLIETTGK